MANFDIRYRLTVCVKSIKLFCVLLVFSVLGYAQSPIKNKILKYSLKDGLSFGIVNSITQDHKGFMWFATNEGLNRFDGTTFKVFKSKQGDSTSLAGNYVQSIFLGQEGAIWVSSRSGLSKLDTRTEKFRHYKFTSGNDVKSQVSSITRSGNGNLWIASYGTGFSHFNTRTTKFTNYTRKSLPQLSGDGIIALLEDSKGRLWIGTDNAGINLFSQKNGKVTGKINIPAALNNLANCRINDIFEDHFHNIWIATSKGLVYYSSYTNTFSQLQTLQPAFKNKRYLSVVEDGNKQLLVGIQDGGVYKVSLSSQSNPVYFSLDPVTGDDNHYITQRSVQTLYMDRDKNIWLGTYDDGICMISNIRERFTNIQKKRIERSGESWMRFYGMCQDF
jgi:ligand-binding sensor domain-containing protein